MKLRMAALSALTLASVTGITYGGSVSAADTPEKSIDFLLAEAQPDQLTQIAEDGVQHKIFNEAHSQHNQTRTGWTLAATYPVRDHDIEASYDLGTGLTRKLCRSIGSRGASEGVWKSYTCSGPIKNVTLTVTYWV